MVHFHINAVFFKSFQSFRKHAIVNFGVNALDSKRIPYRDIHIPQLSFIHNINSKMAVALFAETLEGLPTDDSA
jgi:hypothetical protein